jgi:hypothetical protein
MASIDLDCPKCGARLQIDAIFAGSVCRCGDCGQVMNVPARDDASPQTARPAAPGEDAPPVTQPSATPRKRSRTAKVAAAMALVLLVALGGLFYFAISVNTDDAAEPSGSILGYDPNVNPFILANANFFGVPIDGRVVIAIDASSSSREWLPLAKDVVLDLVDKVDGGSAVQFVFWTESPPPVAYPGDGPAGAIDAPRLADFLDTVSARGLAAAGPALEAALAADPDHVILVCGQPLGDDQIAALTAAAEGHGDVRIDALLIDARSLELTRWASQRGSACVRIPLSQIRQWRQDRD